MNILKSLFVLLAVLCCVQSTHGVIVDDCPPFEPPCHWRGDVNDNGVINITDAIYLSNYLFQGGPQPPCMLAADVNNDTSVNMVDVVLIYAFLFEGCGECIVAPHAVDCE